jgi:HK97 family phage prohead protease
MNEPKVVFRTTFRAEKDDDGVKIVGHAAVFNSLSEDLGGFYEKIAPGAFVKALKKSDARALWNHDPNFLLGRQSSGTLSLKEDDQGLYMEINPPKTSYSKDLMELVARGDVKEQSFGFTVGDESWVFPDDDGALPVRTIREVDRLYDVSLVTYPAYPETDAKLNVRMLERAREVYKTAPKEGEPSEGRETAEIRNEEEQAELTAIRKDANEIKKLLETIKEL